MAIKGENGKVFKQDEDYICEDGKVILTIENNEETLSWVKDSIDEIILTCIYEENAVVEKTNLALNAKSEITYLAKEQKTANAETKIELELAEKIGDIVTLEFTSNVDNLYKGYMSTANGKNTEFITGTSINIGYSELIDKVTFKEETSYIDAKGNVFPSNALYRHTKIAEENLVQILGEDGYINVFDGNGNQITTFNKENLEFTYEGEATNLVFETSKPVKEGILNLESRREIKPLEYSKQQIEDFVNYRLNLVTNISKDNAVIIRGTVVKDITLQNVTSNAELTISKPNISTVVENKGVELRTVLKTTDSSNALYKNPRIEIVLPSYVTDINIESAKLLYEKELKIESAKIYKNENKNLVIDVALNGEQTTYNEAAITEGATIIMNANITANKLTPTRTENIKLNVTNDATEEKIETNAEMRFVAPIRNGNSKSNFRIQ